MIMSIFVCFVDFFSVCFNVQCRQGVGFETERRNEDAGEIHPALTGSSIHSLSSSVCLALTSAWVWPPQSSTLIDLYIITNNKYAFLSSTISF